jgi:hypothetical protein
MILVAYILDAGLSISFGKQYKSEGWLLLADPTLRVDNLGEQNS